MSSGGDAGVTRLPFDRVMVGGPNAAPRALTAAAFLELPLPQRIQLILGREVAFLLGSNAVDRSEALRALRSMQRA
jgi:hypothetical protein